jgi:phosphoribosyl 1,2-cyclic phosphodiesterase
MLGSGSSGNAVLLESGDARILVDAGFGTRRLAARLATIGIPPASIQDCILTHEHTDHIKGAASAAKRWGWSLYATAGTAAARHLARAPVTRVRAGETLSLGGGRFDVQTAATPHDASDPIGLLITARSSGVRAGICYDIGHASAAVRALCAEVDILVLEANHDEGMLWAGPYPPWLCQRIACDTGHLSNKAAGVLAREVASAQLAHVVLAHLSEQNNTPAVAQRTVSRALAGTAFRGRLTTAAQDTVVGPFMPRGMKRKDPLQYSLF